MQPADLRRCHCRVRSQKQPFFFWRGPPRDVPLVGRCGAGCTQVCVSRAAEILKKTDSTVAASSLWSSGQKKNRHQSAERLPSWYREIFLLSGDLSKEDIQKQSAPMSPPKPARRLRSKTSSPECPATSCNSKGPAQRFFVLSAANVGALYGLPTAVARPASPDTVCSDCSTEKYSGTSAYSVASSPSRGLRSSPVHTPQKNLPSWWSSSKRTFELQDPATQLPVFARTELGAAGWLVAHWPDGSMSETDVSNLALRVVQREADVRTKTSCS